MFRFWPEISLIGFLLVGCGTPSNKEDVTANSAVGAKAPGSLRAGLKVLAAVLVPSSVKVRGPPAVNATAPLVPKVRAPVPEASRVPPPAPSVNRRSVETATPV